MLIRCLLVRNAQSEWAYPIRMIKLPNLNDHVCPAHSHVYPLRQRTLQAPIREMLATRQGLGAGVGRGEDGVGTGVM